MTFIFTPLRALTIVGQLALGRDLATVIQEKEAAISALASLAESAFYERCADLEKCLSGGQSQTTCSVPACGSDFMESRGFGCSTSWGEDTATCGTQGLMRSLNTSAVRFPWGTDFNAVHTQAFVCSSIRMDETFRSAHSAGTLKAWQFASEVQGSSRFWPGAAQGRDGERCENFDSRQRPWFIAAASGPKDIIMVFDTSGSMLADTGFGTRHSLVQNALAVLLQTLTTNDWVALIYFSDSASVLGGHSRLQKATAEHVADLQQRLKLVRPVGGTMFVPAFKKAFELFKNTVESSGCTQIILFLTDGFAQDEESSVAAIAALTVGAARETYIFTYAMSSAADTVLPKAIACANNGVFAVINDGTDPLSQMQGYFQFIAAGFASTTVRWTTPYQDALGLGQMVSGALPVYDRRNPDHPLLVGVVGADVTIAELEDFADFKSVVAALVARSAECPVINLTDCRMQKLREKESSESVCPAPAPATTSCTGSDDVVDATPCAATSTGLNGILCSALNQDQLVQASYTDVACCDIKRTGDDSNTGGDDSKTTGDDGGGGSAGAIAGGVVGGVVVLMLIAVIVYCCCCRNTSASHTPNPYPGPVAQHVSGAGQQQIYHV